MIVGSAFGVAGLLMQDAMPEPTGDTDSSGHREWGEPRSHHRAIHMAGTFQNWTRSSPRSWAPLRAPL